MKNKFVTLFAMPLATMTLAACGHDYHEASVAPGHYESTRAFTDPYGTEHVRSTDTDVWYDENGEQHAFTQRKATRDPQGLFNKSTTTTYEYH